jgi:hypothetical protein
VHLAYRKQAFRSYKPDLISLAQAQGRKQRKDVETVRADFSVGDKLVQVKDMQDALKLQSEFFQDQMRTLTDQAKRMRESAIKAAGYL